MSSPSLSRKKCRAGKVTATHCDKTFTEHEAIRNKEKTADCSGWASQGRFGKKQLLPEKEKGTPFETRK